ncbi:Phage terminase, small subunit [Escherichia phage Evi]|nr:Phage terminase, small subunit [Escherichia phage Evi]
MPRIKCRRGGVFGGPDIIGFTYQSFNHIPKKTAKKDEKGLPKIPQHLGSQGKYWFRRMAEELNAEGIISHHELSE